jgi:hypothetical protein
MDTMIVEENHRAHRRIVFIVNLAVGRPGREPDG